MTKNQRLMMVTITAILFAVTVLPAILLFLAGEIILFGTWTICSFIVWGIILFYTFHPMKPGAMAMLVCLGHAYSLYTPLPQKVGSNYKQNGIGVGDTGLLVTYFPGLVRPVYLPIGLVEVPLLSNSSNTKEKDGEKHVTPVTTYIHFRIMLKQDEEQMKEFYQNFLAGSGHYDFTHIIKIEYFVGRDVTDEIQDQVPTTEERRCACFVQYMIGILQSAVDEAVTRGLEKFDFTEARFATREVEDEIRNGLQEPDSVWRKKKLEDMFEVLEITVLAIVASNKAVRDAQSAGMEKKLLAAGVYEEAVGEARALTEKQKVLETDGGKIGLAGEIAMKAAENAGLILTSDPSGLASNMVLANRIASPKAPEPAPPAKP